MNEPQRRRRGRGRGARPAAASTIPDPVSMLSISVGMWMRRALFALFALYLAAALLGRFENRKDTVSASGGGYELQVEYASLSRPGLDTPWSVTVTHDGGFDGPITVRTTSSYFDIYDENGLDPDPDSATADGKWTVWEFAPPDGDELAIGFDARISPAHQSGARGTTQVVVDGRPVVSVDYTTELMP